MCRPHIAVAIGRSQGSNPARMSESLKEVQIVMLLNHHTYATSDEVRQPPPGHVFHVQGVFRILAEEIFLYKALDDEKPGAGRE